MVARNVSQSDRRMRMNEKKRMWVPLRMMVPKIRTPRPILIVLYSRRANTVVSITKQPVQEMAES